ncbi:MAG: transcription termination/antitermination NusG family protein [Erythrobacter sp.]
MTRSRENGQWYLAQVKPNCAQIAQRNLEQQSFECFLPYERYTARLGGRFTSKKRLYFPSYLFVSSRTSSAPWRAIISTQGVAQLVRFGEQPATVPPQIIFELQVACDHEGCIEGQASLATGDDVRIEQGPFVGFAGKVDKEAPEQRVWVLLDVMGKATRVSIQRDDLRLTG